MRHDALSVGVDAGGTTSRAVLTTADGECIGYGRGGRGNPISAGVDLAATGVLTAIEAALARSAGALTDVSVVAVAMAGQRAGEGEGDWLRARLTAEGFTGILTFESDLMATYSSGSAEDFGYAVVAGTGACAVRVEGGRVEATGDGLGWLLGDRGSGFWIGRRVVRAAVRDLDGSGPETALTAAALAQLGITADAVQSPSRPRALERLVEAVYAMRPIELAALAPLAFVDDPVAETILRTAGERLADTFAEVLRGPGPVVIGGSVLSRPGLVREVFAQRLDAEAVDLELRPVTDGAVGAGLLALRAGGIPVSEQTRVRLDGSLARLR